MKNRIRVERAEVRMTQQQLADAIGVSRQTVNAIEAGRFVPSTVLALKIARIFGKPVEQVFQLEEGTDRGDIPADRHEGTVPHGTVPFVFTAGAPFRTDRPRLCGVTQLRKPYNLMS